MSNWVLGAIKIAIKITAVGIPSLASKFGMVSDLWPSDELRSNTTPHRLSRAHADIIYAQLEFRMAWQHDLVAER